MHTAWVTVIVNTFECVTLILLSTVVFIWSWKKIGWVAAYSLITVITTSQLDLQKMTASPSVFLIALTSQTTPKMLLRRAKRAKVPWTSSASGACWQATIYSYVNLMLISLQLDAWTAEFLLGQAIVDDLEVLLGSFFSRSKLLWMFNAE